METDVGEKPIALCLEHAQQKHKYGVISVSRAGSTARQKIRGGAATEVRW